MKRPGGQGRNQAQAKCCMASQIASVKPVPVKLSHAISPPFSQALPHPAEEEGTYDLTVNAVKPMHALGSKDPLLEPADVSAAVVERVPGNRVVSLSVDRSPLAIQAGGGDYLGWGRSVRNRG